MSLSAWLRNAFGFHGRHRTPPGAPETPGGHAALDVPRLLGQDDDAFAPLFESDPADMPLALGNLYREQGDIDQAVRLRERILEQAGDDDSLKARAWFELGRDYRSTGLLDRALTAYKEARRLNFAPDRLGEELTRFHADSGDFAAAAAEAALLGNAAAEACYLVRQARESAARHQDDEAATFIRRALAVYPGSPEAGLALASMNLLRADAAKALEAARAALERASPSGKLIFLEGLYAFIKGAHAPDIDSQCLPVLAQGLHGILALLEPDATLCYYAGLFLQSTGSPGPAEQWYTKALILDPDFWAPRLALLDLAASRESLPPLLKNQIDFFTAQGARARRFICPPCGLRRDTIFSQCPRCRAWHSAAFRLRLT